MYNDTMLPAPLEIVQVLPHWEIELLKRENVGHSSVHSTVIPVRCCNAYRTVLYRAERQLYAAANDLYYDTIALRFRRQSQKLWSAL